MAGQQVKVEIKRALVSVYDKTGLEELVRGLHEAGVELVSTGGSAALIAGLGLTVTKVEDLAGFPEWGHVHPPTGCVRLLAGDQPIVDQPVAPDPERLWNAVQTVLLPRLRDHVMCRGPGQVCGHEVSMGACPQDNHIGFAFFGRLQDSVRCMPELEQCLRKVLQFGVFGNQVFQLAKILFHGARLASKASVILQDMHQSESSMKLIREPCRCRASPIASSTLFRFYCCSTLRCPRLTVSKCWSGYGKTLSSIACPLRS